MYPYNTTDKILLHILLIAVMVLFFFIIFVKKNLSTFYNCKKKKVPFKCIFWYNQITVCASRKKTSN